MKILLAEEGLSTNILFHAMLREGLVDKVVLCDSRSKRELLRKRIIKIGFVRVFGQILFRSTVYPLLRCYSKKRHEQILSEHNLIQDPINEKYVIRTESLVNHDATKNILRVLNPNIIIVCLNSILSKSLLESTSATFINIHAGITPMYRGVHGAYWAIVEKDKTNAGVTLHYVDNGIDTGQIISQSHIDISTEDNFSTYPLLQIAMGVDMLVDFLKHGKRRILEQKLENSSALYSHPTLWQYLYYRLTRQAK